MFQQIKLLIKKEILIEWRNRYTFGGIMLYLISSIFVCYLSFMLKEGTISIPTWNALFWIILMLTSISAIAKSFLQESSKRTLYYYLLASPSSIIISKLIYNVILMLILAFIDYAFFSLVFDNIVLEQPLFILNLVLGAIGFSSTFTIISAIVAKADGNGTLMAILSFPIVLPMQLMLINISRNAIDGLAWSHSTNDLMTLIAINTIVLVMSLLLFPFVWRS